MNETIKVELEIQTDADNIKSTLKKIRAKLIEVQAMDEIRNVTTWQFNRDRGIWLTYGWGIGKGSTEIWVPLQRGEMEDKQ